jgi:hypothetical protein
LSGAEEGARFSNLLSQGYSGGRISVGNIGTGGTGRSTVASMSCRPSPGRGICYGKAPIEPFLFVRRCRRRAPSRRLSAATGPARTPGVDASEIEIQNVWQPWQSRARCKHSHVYTFELSKSRVEPLPGEGQRGNVSVAQRSEVSRSQSFKVSQSESFQSFRIRVSCVFCIHCIPRRPANYQITNFQITKSWQPWSPRARFRRCRMFRRFRVKLPASVASIVSLCVVHQKFRQPWPP